MSSKTDQVSGMEKVLALYPTINRLNMGELCKVVIPRGTGQSYGIHWRSEMRVTDETKVTDGRNI